MNQYVSGKIYRGIKKVWRAVAPDGGIEQAFGSNSAFARIALFAKANLEAGASHDDIYDEAYYRKYESQPIGGKQIVSSLRSRYDFASAVDVGCGAGEILNELRKAGIPARGIEHSVAALTTCHRQGLEVHDFDLESDATLDWKADLVISTEVAEHLPASCADRYVRLMAEMANQVIVLTAALPGQGGADHVNEQPYSYWIEKLEAFGWRYRNHDTESLRAEWAAAGVEAQRARNVMIFTKVV